MTPRRRQTDNESIAATACRLLVEHGISAVTFAEVGKRCGLAPPTLIQRFATREGLLQAMAAALAAEISPLFQAAGSLGGALNGLRSALITSAPLQLAAVHLAPFAPLEGYARELRLQISFFLARAIEAGELPRVDVARTARMLQIAFAGAVTQAALERGDSNVEIAAAIDAQLADYI